MTFRRTLLSAVSALGLAPAAFAQSVSPGERADRAPVDEIIVTGERADEDTLDRKRFSINIRDVIDLDFIQSNPDQDLSETLDRLPGLSIQQSSARGFRSQFITVRGIQPELNNVTVLGQEIISSQGDRSVALDLLPANAASVVEIYKSLSPDLDANAIGGTVNIIPLSAFDHEESTIDLRVQGGITEQFEAVTDQGVIPVEDDFPLDIRGALTHRFGENNEFGIAVSGNYFQQTLPIILSQCDDWRFAAGDPAELPADFQLCEGQRLENGRRRIDRYSVNATLEWVPSEASRVFLSSIYTESEEDNVSTQTEWNFSDAGDFTDVALLSPGVFFNGEGENEKELDVDNETEEFFFVAGGGEHRMGQFFFDASASYSRAESNEDIREWSFDSSNFASTIDFNERRPFATPADPAAFNDPASFEFDEIDIEPTRTVTDTFQAKINARRDFTRGGLRGFVQAGAKYRTTDAVNDREENQFEATPGGPLDGATLADFGLAANDVFAFGLPIGPTINATVGEEFVAANPGALFFNAAASIDDAGESDFQVSEDVIAGYFMTQLNYGQFGVIAGVRVEYTETEATSTVFNEVTRELGSETLVNDYTDVLPTVQVRWEPTDQIVLRGSWNRSIARPVLRQLAGFTEIDFDNADVIGPNQVSDGSASRGNPFLDPFESDNFDVSLEFYPSENSVFAIAGFYKDIDNPIFGGSTNFTDTVVGGVLFGDVSVSQPVNAGSAEILGLEAQMNHKLDYLPGMLGGLGLFANFTYIDGDLNLEDAVPGREGQVLRLFQQPDYIATVSPYFEYKGFNARVTWSYTGDQLFSVNEGLPSQGVDVIGDAEFDLFQDDRFELDFQLSYDLTENFSIFASGENVTEESFETFQGDKANLESEIREPSTYWFGVRARF